MSRDLSPETIHFTIDIIRAIQHVIIDPLNELPRDEISNLFYVKAIREILSDTFHIMICVDNQNERDPATPSASRQFDNEYRGSIGSWGSEGIDQNFNSSVARRKNSVYATIPGITRSTIEGLINNLGNIDRKIETSGVSYKIMRDLRQFLPELKKLKSLWGPGLLEGLIDNIEQPESAMIRSFT